MIEISEREESWRKKVESQFKDSLQDIRSKIDDHESKYETVLTENHDLREKLATLLEHDKKRNGDIEKYKEHHAKLEEIYEKEKEHLNEKLKYELIEMYKQNTGVNSDNFNIKNQEFKFYRRLDSMDYNSFNFQTFVWNLFVLLF